jgi:tetratricopeptide (TPR) repeat protein
VLLVATHWSAQWHDRQHVVKGSFAERFWSASVDPDFGSIIELAAEPALSMLVRSGLPGLSDADAALVLSKADGNPQVLIEVIELVRRSRAWLTNGALSSHARHAIAEASTSVSRLAIQRLLSDSVDEETRIALAVASFQGMEFLSEIVNLIGTTYAMGPLNAGLAAAESRHRVILRVTAGIQGFSQRAYFEAAQSLVSSHLGDGQKVVEQYVQVLHQRLRDPEWRGSLSESELLAALGVFVAISDQSSDRDISMHAGDSLLSLIKRTRAGGDYTHGGRLALLFDRGLNSRWAISDFPLEKVNEAYLALVTAYGEVRGTGLARAILVRAREIAEENPTIESMTMLCSALANAGESAWAVADWQQAFAAYEEIGAIERTLMEQASHSVLFKRRLSGTLRRLGWFCLKKGERASAEKLCEESLQLAVEAVDAQRTQATLLGLSRSLVAVTKTAERGVAAAYERKCERLFQALSIARELVDQNPSPGLQDHLAGVLHEFGNIVGDQVNPVFLAGGGGEPFKLQEAENCFRESLAIHEALAKRNGTPSARASVAVSLHALGQIARLRRDFGSAESMLRQCLSIKRGIASEVATLESESDVQSALHSLVLVMTDQRPLPNDCWTLAKESVGLARRQWAERKTPEAKEDLLRSMRAARKTAELGGDLGTAEQLRQEVLALRGA